MSFFLLKKYHAVDAIIKETFLYRCGSVTKHHGLGGKHQGSHMKHRIRMGCTLCDVPTDRTGQKILELERGQPRILSVFYKMPTHGKRNVPWGKTNPRGGRQRPAGSTQAPTRVNKWIVENVLKRCEGGSYILGRHVGLGDMAFASTI